MTEITRGRPSAKGKGEKGSCIFHVRQISAEGWLLVCTKNTSLG